MRRLAGQVLLLASLAGAGAAHAYTAGIPFTGAVSAINSCTINVTQHGDFGLSANGRVLSSKLAGGRAGIATVTSGSNYYVSATTYPSFILAPPGGSTSTTFQVRYSGQSISRGRTFTERLGSSRVRLRTGASITRITMHLIATRTGSAFPGGNYTGEVVLHCE